MRHNKVLLKVWILRTKVAININKFLDFLTLMARPQLEKDMESIKYSIHPNSKSDRRFPPMTYLGLHHEEANLYK